MKRKWFLTLFLFVLAGAMLSFVSVLALEGYSLDWWTVDGGGGGGGAGTNSTGGSYSLAGSIGQPDAGTASGGTYSLFGGFWGGVENIGTQSLPLVTGWNLVSFNVHPADTSITSVLSSLGNQYSLVYAWDASTNAWLIYDPTLGNLNDLKTLDEHMGFWIRMISDQTLVVSGSVPGNTSIDLKSGWNLVGYPSAGNSLLPDALSAHGVGSDFSLVYAYHANEGSAAWKLFDRLGNPLLNDLTELAPGWGYWVKASVAHTWTVP